MALPMVGAIAGSLATALFVASAIPMVVRAARTRDLSSYSPANLIIANVANTLQTIYLLTLPPGPIWALHGCNTAVSALMLWWWYRHHGPRPRLADPPPPTKEKTHDHPAHRRDR